MVDFSKLLNQTPEERQAVWAEIDKRLEDKQKARDQKIADLCSIEDGLTEWEVNFVESIARQYELQNHLTDRQWEMVNKILEDQG